MKLKSTFAILDVKGGRSELRKHYRKLPRLGPCPPRFRIPVTIKGYIDGPWSGDDGISQEFSVTVESLTAKARKKP